MTGVRLLIATLAVLGAGSAPVMSGELYAHAALTLHRGPGPGFAVVSTVGAGTPITVLWCNADAEWCLISAERGQGWARLEALKVARPGGGTPAEAGGSTSGGRPPGGVAASVSAGGVGAAVSVGGGQGVSVGVSTPAASVAVTTK